MRLPEGYVIDVPLTGDFVFRFQAFLQNLFRLFDMDGENCLVQDKWIEHLKGRLT